jgi:hypothetical protein
VSIKLGDLLVRANLVAEGQLQAALAEQQRHGGRLGEILVRMGYCDEEIVVRAVSKQLNLPRADLDGLPALAPEVLAQLRLKVPEVVAKELDLVPLQLRDEGRTLVVALADPLDLETVDALRARTGCKVTCLIAGTSALERARARVYGAGTALDADADSGLKLTDAQGRTVVQAAPEARPGLGAAQLLGALEGVQRKEVAALKAMVELLIEKGVFTREEYLARVKR